MTLPRGVPVALRLRSSASAVVRGESGTVYQKSENPGWVGSIRLPFDRPGACRAHAPPQISATFGPQPG
jgi:hypothetical protein